MDEQEAQEEEEEDIFPPTEIHVDIDNTPTDDNNEEGEEEEEEEINFSALESCDEEEEGEINFSAIESEAESNADDCPISFSSEDEVAIEEPSSPCVSLNKRKSPEAVDLTSDVETSLPVTLPVAVAKRRRSSLMAHLHSRNKLERHLMLLLGDCSAMMQYSNETVHGKLMATPPEVVAYELRGAIFRRDTRLPKLHKLIMRHVPSDRRNHHHLELLNALHTSLRADCSVASLREVYKLLERRGSKVIEEFTLDIPMHFFGHTKPANVLFQYLKADGVQSGLYLDYALASFYLDLCAIILCRYYTTPKRSKKQ